jgi:hypothetical protein
VQLQLQFGQIRGLFLEELRVSQAQQLFLFGVKVEIFVDAFDDGGLEASDLMNLVEKIVQWAVERGEKD